MINRDQRFFQDRFWSKIVGESTDLGNETGRFFFEFCLDPRPGEDHLSERFWIEDIELAKNTIRKFGGYDGYCHREGYSLWAGFKDLRKCRTAHCLLRRVLDRNRLSWKVLGT